MSLITKCPACTTMFKVVPDQLRVSEGWVRCGQCNEVFDANLNLQVETNVVTSGVVDEAPHLSETAPQEHSTILTASAADSIDLPDVPDDHDRDPFLAVNPHALHLESEAFLSDAQAPKKPLDELDDLNASPQVDASVVGEYAVEHSFLRPEQVPSATPSRAVRVVLSILGLVLGLMLAMQVVLRERDRIAALLPGMKESLEALCSVTGCSIAPMRHIEAVVIDSSSFVKIRADVYRLSFVLKNTAHTSIATPALELTLTDTQDQPIVRRVFTGIDFGDKSGSMEVGAELSITMPINVKLAGNHEKISGYRLLSFYP